MASKRLLVDAIVLKTLFDVRYDTAFIQERTTENREQWNGYCTGINWGRNTIAAAPSVDAVEVPDAQVRKAVELLCKNYEAAKKKPFVQHPLAYALFHTWKEIDRKGGARE